MIETLKLDFDNREFSLALKILKARSSIFRVLRDWRIIGCRVFETRKGYHVYLEIDAPKLTPLDFAFMQLLLGSDYMREANNYFRTRYGLSEDWNFMFGKKFDGHGTLLSSEVERPELAGVLLNEIMEG